jgi:hypothetical protein
VPLRRASAALGAAVKFSSVNPQPMPRSNRSRAAWVIGTSLRLPSTTVRALSDHLAEAIGAKLMTSSSAEH